eukprot:6058772-Lingulodinium_polyedra.AAC.1
MFTTHGGEDLCPSPGAVATRTEDIAPRCSWFSYHGTSITSALTAISMNFINKSEAVRRRKTENDTNNMKSETPYAVG